MTAIKKCFEVSLDIKRPVSNRDFEVVEGDSGNELLLTLTDGGAAVDLTDCRVLAIFSKSTGTSMQDSLAAEGGVQIGGAGNNAITIALFTSSFAPGTVECEIQVYSGPSHATLVTSAKFNFKCRRSILNQDTIVSTNEYPLLTGLISQVQSLQDFSDSKADLVHTHAVDDVTDIGENYSQVGHTHVADDVTDLGENYSQVGHAHAVDDITDISTAYSQIGHTHGAITSSGAIGAEADMAVFTGASGALGTKSAAEALSALGTGPALNSDLTLYVATTGSDTTGDGSSGAPYASLLHALGQVPKNLGGYKATINVASGTYTGTADVIIKYFSGGALSIVGESSSKPIFYATLYFGSSSAEISVQNLQWQNYTTCAVHVGEHCFVTLSGCVINGGGSRDGIQKYGSGNISLSGVEIKNCVTGVNKGAGAQGGEVAFYSVSGTGNTTAAVVNRYTLRKTYGVTISGSYTKSYGGLIINADGTLG